MLSVAEAQAALLALATPPKAETVPLIAATGRFLTEELTARRTQPTRALSAMDGYAIAHDAQTTEWRVVGDIAAGTLPQFSVSSGEAARIFTGAPLPSGADTIVIQEDVQREGAAIKLTGARPECGAHVRTAGSDFSEDDALLAAGMPVTAGAIALAAMAGHDQLIVGARPRVALLSTGNELLPVGAPPQDGRIPSSNAPMLAAQLAALGIASHDLGIASDEMTDLSARITAARAHDVLVTTGGVSVGDHDLLQPVLRALGADIAFWRVAIRPGKPILVARLGDTIVLGLPGNPASAFVTAHLFLLPLLRQLMGSARPLPMIATARLASDLPPVGPRALYIRAVAENGLITPFSSLDSGLTQPLAAANALLIRAVNAGPARTGDLVEYHPL